MSTKLWVPYGTSTPFALVISPVQYRVHFIHSSKHTGRKRKSWINIKKPTQYPESLGTAVKYRARVFVPGRFLRGPQRACRYWLCHLLYKAFTIQRHFFRKNSQREQFWWMFVQTLPHKILFRKVKVFAFSKYSCKRDTQSLRTIRPPGGAIKKTGFYFQKEKNVSPFTRFWKISISVLH